MPDTIGAMRALVLVLLIAVAAAGCGGGGGGGTTVDLVIDNTDPNGPPPAKGVDDPTLGEALTAFVDAAVAKDVDAMWERFSVGTRQRVGPTLEAFREGVGEDFLQGVGSFKPGEFDVVVSARTSPTMGVASVAGKRIEPASKKEEFETFGAALLKEEGEWKLELVGPVVLTLITPEERLPTRHLAVAVDVEAGAPVLEVGVWVDGKQYASPTEGPDPTSMTIFSEPEVEFEPGDHTLLAFASMGDSATATSWTFVVSD